MQYKQSKLVFVKDAILMLFGIGFITVIFTFLDYISNYLEVKDSSLLLKTGFLKVVRHEIQYNKINSITIEQSLFGRMFNYGTIVIVTGNNISGIKFKNIDNPEEIKNLIDEKMSK